MPLLLVAAVVLLAVLVDCFLPTAAEAAESDATHPKLTSKQRELLDLLGPGVVGKPIDLPAITHVRNWYPLQHDDGVYSHASGPKKGNQEQVSLRWVKRDPKEPMGSETGAWRLHSHGRSIKYLTEAKGHLRLPTETDLHHGVITVFDPPEPILLADVSAGESRTMTAQVSVYDLHDPGTLKYQGSVQETYTDLGGYMVHVPRGTYEARLISVRTVGKIGPADVNTEDLAFYAKGVGRIAYIDRKHISAFLLYNKTTQTGMVLAKLPDVDPAEPAPSTAP